MSFNKDNTLNWVRNGIQKETIDAAFIAGWNFVCPNHKINRPNDIVTLSKKEKGVETIVFSKKFEDLSQGERGKLNDNNKSDSLTTSQIRIAFGEMRKIQSNGYKKSSFLMLKPKLAYAVKRHDKKGLNEFYKIFVWAYDAVDTQNEQDALKHFENFMQIMEALLAYHKFHGGRE
jgi:CRISPR-associated protein Csm2